MIVEFDSEEVKISCTQAGMARVAYGLANEKKLLKVMTALNSAKHLSDAKAIYASMHWLSGDRHWQVGIPLAGGHRLIVEPLSYSTREWHNIDSIKVICIMDYHK